METFIKIAILLSGLYLLIMGVIMSTKNLSSALIFKAIPMLLGLSLLITWLFLNGWLIAIQ